MIPSGKSITDKNKSLQSKLTWESTEIETLVKKTALDFPRMIELPLIAKGKKDPKRIWMKYPKTFLSTKVTLVLTTTTMYVTMKQ